jgi:phospholipid/cholesterol/gamma-HCH transport system substrate-binding protein
MENKSHALAAGIFVLVVSALLAGLGFWLMRDTGTYRTYELVTRDTVTGLQQQAQVRYKGVSVGKVTRIGFDPTVAGQILMRIQVQEGTPVSDRTFASLNYQGVTGLAFIQLDDGKAPQPAPPQGPSGIARLPMQTSQLGRLAESAPAILADVKQVTSRLNEMLDEAHEQQVFATINNIGQAAANIARLTARVEKTLAERLDPALASIPPVMQGAGATLQSLQGATREISGTAREIGNTARRLNEPDGPLDRLAEGTEALGHAVDQFSTATLPRVNRVADDASRVVRQLGRTATNINDNPQSLLFGNGKARPGPGEDGYAPGEAP